jgi:hypothetical protein
MALRMGALYDALRTAQGITEDDARRAAEEVASYDNRMAAIDTRMAVLTWMVGFLIALMVGNLWLTVSILARLPRP